MEMRRGTVTGYHGNGGTPVTVSGWPGPWALGIATCAPLAADLRSHALLWRSDRRTLTREAYQRYPALVGEAMPPVLVQTATSWGYPA